MERCSYQNLFLMKTINMLFSYMFIHEPEQTTNDVYVDRAYLGFNKRRDEDKRAILGDINKCFRNTLKRSCFVRLRCLDLEVCSYYRALRFRFAVLDNIIWMFFCNIVCCVEPVVLWSLSSSWLLDVTCVYYICCYFLRPSFFVKQMEQ